MRNPCDDDAAGPCLGLIDGLILSLDVECTGLIFDLHKDSKDPVFAQNNLSLILKYQIYKYCEGGDSLFPFKYESFLAADWPFNDEDDGEEFKYALQGSVFTFTDEEFDTYAGCHRSLYAYLQENLNATIKCYIHPCAHREECSMWSRGWHDTFLSGPGCYEVVSKYSPGNGDGDFYDEEMARLDAFCDNPFRLSYTIVPDWFADEIDDSVQWSLALRMAGYTNISGTEAQLFASCQKQSIEYAGNNNETFLKCKGTPCKNQAACLAYVEGEGAPFNAECETILQKYGIENASRGNFEPIFTDYCHKLSLNPATEYLVASSNTTIATSPSPSRGPPAFSRLAVCIAISSVMLFL